MRTRAQQSRDAALRRLTRINRSLAAVALVGTGVITDIVANTASGHTRVITTTSVSAGRPATVRQRAAERHRAERTAERPRSSAAPTVTASSSSSSSSVPASSAAASTAPVVAVSGGS